MDTFIGVCKEISVPIASDKAESPTTVITYLGYIIESDLLQIQILHNKIVEFEKNDQCSSSP